MRNTCHEPSTDLLCIFLFTAVKPSLKEKKGPLWHIAVVSGALLGVIVVCLCVHAPCGCLWPRTHRHGKYEVVCPTAGSHREMCGKCFLQSNATDVTISMDKCDARYHQSSSQVNFFRTYQSVEELFPLY